MICFDAINNVNFGDIVLKEVANQPVLVIQSPLDNWFSLMPSDFFYFLGYELSKYLKYLNIQKLN